jgi:hypothetical protein
MYLGGFIHREQLFNIAKNWIGDRLDQNDAWLISEIFAYEGFVSTPPIKKFIVDFLSELNGQHVKSHNVSFKHQVKEAVVRSIPKFDDRLDDLVFQFKTKPEEYFPRSPLNGIIYYTEDKNLSGMLRIKRARRVAEKVSRRMGDLSLKHIRKKAENLAKNRASKLNIPFEMLLTSHEQMVKEFETAERQLAEQFTHGKIPIEPNDVAIHDVIGIKIIGDREKLEKAEQMLLSHPDLIFVEKEVHKGDYNAVNIQVDYKLPPVGLIVDNIFSRMDPPFPTTRGISQEELIEGFPQYVNSGARTVRIELILTTYPDLVESEIGRSIHEERTLKQRKQRAYTGRIAKNAEFIIEYLISVAFSPKTDINFIPVKLIGHYLPETISYAIRRLFTIENSALFPNLNF